MIDVPGIGAQITNQSQIDASSHLSKCIDLFSLS